MEAVVLETRADVVVAATSDADLFKYPDIFDELFNQSDKTTSLHAEFVSCLHSRSDVLGCLRPQDRHREEGAARAVVTKPQLVIFRRIPWLK